MWFNLWCDGSRHHKGGKRSTGIQQNTRNRYKKYKEWYTNNICSCIRIFGCFPPFYSPRGPCCPSSVNVSQVTQAMTNVTWSSGTGARSYITTLTSSRGHAKCHTLDTHCLMGCITCGTNYSVNLEAISSTGHTSECRYRGFSSSEKNCFKRYASSSPKM